MNPENQTDDPDSTRAAGSMTAHEPSDRVRTPPRSRRFILVTSAVAVLLAAGAGAYVVTRGGEPKVVVARAIPALVQAEPGGVGALASAPQDVFNIALDAVGVAAPITVERLFVVPGSVVSAGARLLQLDPTPFRQDVAHVEATLSQAQSELAAAVTENAALHPRPGGYATPGLATTIAGLRGDVQIDSQLLRIAEGNATSIAAPAAGDVAAVYVGAGSVVEPGEPVMQIVSLATVQVSTTVLLSDLRTIKVGAPATIAPDELPGVELRGSVTAVEPTASGGGLQGTVLVTANNLARDPVPLGTQVFVAIDAWQRADVTVPDIAVLDPQVDPMVFVVREGRVYPVAVTLGASDLTRTAILSNLSDGADVVVSNTENLSAGERVHVTRVTST